mgnify:CR=1 FL=1
MNFEEIKEKYNININQIKKKNNFINQGGDLYLWGYDKIYENYFGQIKASKLKICEVGVFEGEKLFILSKYFPNVEIYGYDIDTSYVKKFEDEDFNNKVQEIVEIDSTKPNNIEHIFDIIIDDGDHRPSAIIKTFNNFYSKLKNGGLYIIEDVTFLRKQVLLPLFQRKFNCKFEINHMSVKNDPEYHGIIVIKK